MHKLLLLLFSVILSFSLWAGGTGGGSTGPSTPPNNCATANGFCTGTNYNFPNNTGVSSLGGGGIYGCLGSTPNPIWYYMQIDQPGNMTINISQTSGDIDFVLWGPFSSLASGCSSLSASNIVSCSYSTAANETATINNAQSGQVYILLLTNYSNQSGNISFSSGPNSTASTSCNVLCNMTGFTATAGACVPATGQYSVTGQITFQNPPTSGTLTVSSTCGQSMTIPAPWTSPISYTLPGLTANGAPCSITATFSADAACTMTQNYTAPAACSGCTITAGNSGPVCPGGTVNLTATTVAGASGYSWTGPNGYTSTSQNPAAVAVPSAPGSYTYTVTATFNGQTCNSSTTVVVQNPTVNAGPDQTVCAGQSVTLTATGATTYAWDNGVTNGAAFTPTATTTYTVTGTTSGCTATDQVVVTVNPLPVVNAGNDFAVCADTPIALTGTGGTPSWNNGVTNGVTFMPTATTTYTYTGTTAGCSATDQIVVTVNPLPVANAGADQAVCAGTPVTLTGSGGTPSWSGGIADGVAFTPSSTNTYTLTVTDANNCTASDQVVVTVNPNSVINAGQDVVVCSGTQVTLIATGGTYYTWTNGVTNGTPFTPPVGTTTYTATDNNPTGCSGSDQVVVTVNPNPTIGAGADALICEGTSIVLSGTGGATYSWDNGVTNGVPFTPQSTATYTVTGTDANGCTGTDQLIVTITPTPVVSFTPNVTSGCVPLSVTFTNNNQTNNTYQWILGNGSTSTSAASATAVYTTPGCYDVALISTTPNGCVGQVLLQSIVCVNPNPVASFTANPPVLTQLDSYAVMVNGSSGAASYIWDFGDNTNYSTVTAPAHLFPSDVSGSYQVVLVAVSEFGCKDTATVNIEVQDELIYYIPNAFTPDDDEYNPVFKPVFTAGFDPMDYRMTIFNRWGEVVFESRDADYGWDGTYTGTAGRVQDGTYTWRIEFKTTRSDERKILAGSVTLAR